MRLLKSIAVLFALSSAPFSVNAADETQPFKRSEHVTSDRINGAGVKVKVPGWVWFA
jgi:hypothetical protein